MELEVYNPQGTPITTEQRALIAKAREAVAHINRNFEMRLGADTERMVAIAWIHGFGPKTDLHLDFKSHAPSRPSSGHADLGPLLPLAPCLFEDTRFTPEVLRKIEVAFTNFSEYCKTA